MIRLKFIEKTNAGQINLLVTGVRTGDDQPDLSIQKNHFQSLELAKKSLENESPEVRDFTSLTLPLSLADLPEAKVMIRDFQNQLFERFNAHQKPDQVYRIAVQLFPLTQIASPSRKKKNENFT